MSIRPAIIGSMSRPDAAAEVPVDICRKVGMNARAANMHMPRKNPIAVATMKMRFVNRESGMMGSLALDSISTKTSPARSAPAPHIQVSIACQPWLSDPPKSVKKIRHVVVIERKMTPRTSIRFSGRCEGRRRKTTATSRARTPSGTLT